MVAEPTVYIVDDDEAARDSLSWLIRSVNLHVKAFASAAEFLEQSGSLGPGCLILDIRMPGMSGLELLSRLRDEEVVLPVIFVTGHGDVPMAVRALKEGAVDFLEKPFNDQVLLDSVHNALEMGADLRKEQNTRAEIAAKYSTLTAREKEIMGLIVEGSSNREVASALSISIKTVETHRARIMEKMSAPSLSHLVRLALTLSASK